MAKFFKQFRSGTVDSLPFYIVVLPFGLVFGVLGMEAGLNLTQVMSMSFLVVAGASQLTALQLISDNAPTIIVITAALAVNLRMAMYSASLVPHMGQAPFWLRGLAAYFLFDQPYGMSMLKFENRPNLSIAEKYGYFLGIGMPMAILWYLTTLVGAVLGEKLPAELGMEFAVPIMFLAIVAPMLKSIAHIATAFSSVVCVLLFSFMPYGSGLLVAALIALCVGTGVETWVENRHGDAE